MRILRPQLVKGSIQQQVAVGEKVVVRGPFVYKLPAPPNWVSGAGFRWAEELIDGLLHRGWFKDSDVYLRVDPDENLSGHPLAYVIPSCRSEGAFVLPGERVENLLVDAQLLPRFENGALFIKTSP